MSDWGTTFPSLEGVNEATKLMESEGLDVHTVTIMLNNGLWQVTILATDEDLDAAELLFWMDNHGGVDHLELKELIVRKEKA